MNVLRGPCPTNAQRVDLGQNSRVACDLVQAFGRDDAESLPKREILAKDDSHGTPWCPKGMDDFLTRFGLLG